MSDNVHVCIRCRPLLSREMVGGGGVPCLSFLSDKRHLVVGRKEKEFVFDRVFDDHITQDVIYDATVEPLIEGLFLGFNASILAYGQTGSGKTYTMGTAADTLDSDENMGIVPRAISQMFGLIDQRPVGAVINVRCSFLEIYNEELRDLLHPEIPSRDILIREDSEGRIFFTGAREVAVSAQEELFRLLERGSLSRTTADTLMNSASSRSHAIFTVTVDSINYQGDAASTAAPKSSQAGINANSGSSSCVQSKLQLVDLAGSERAKKTGASGTRLKESVGINQGLLSLGKVIRALTSKAHMATTSSHASGIPPVATQQLSYVPYRESKLTRLLQDSLGGNSRTVFVACISSAEANLHETLTTLQYASRVRTVRNRPRANISAPSEPTIEEDVSVVASLRAQLKRLEEEMIRYRRHDPLLRASLDRESQSQLPLSLPLQSRTQPVAPAEPQDDLEGMYLTASSTNALGSSSSSSGSDSGSGSGSGTVAQQVRDLSVRAQEIRDMLQMSIVDLEERTYAALASESKHSVAAGARGPGVSLLASSLDLEKRFGIAKGLLMGAKSASAALGRLADRLDSVSVSSKTGATAGVDVTVLRAELEEAKADLVRDEEIFAAKVRELKRARRDVRSLQQQNTDLEASLHVAQSQLREQLAASASAGAESEAQRGIEANENAMATSTGAGAAVVALDLSTPESETDILGVEESVLLAEPDISRLMEDLEGVSRERERLCHEKDEAESTAARLTKQVQLQRETADKAAAALRRQLKELQIAIRLKQSLIGNLAVSENRALEEAADERRARGGLESLLEQKQQELEKAQTRESAARGEAARLLEEKRTADDKASLAFLTAPGGVGSMNKTSPEPWIVDAVGLQPAAVGPQQPRDSHGSISARLVSQDDTGVRARIIEADGNGNAGGGGSSSGATVYSAPASSQPSSARLGYAAAYARKGDRLTGGDREKKVRDPERKPRSHTQTPTGSGGLTGRKKQTTQTAAAAAAATAAAAASGVAFGTRAPVDSLAATNAAAAAEAAAADEKERLRVEVLALRERHEGVEHQLQEVQLARDKQVDVLTRKIHKMKKETKETVARMSQLEGKNSDLQSRLQKLRGATLGPGADRNAAGSGSSPDSSPSRDLAVDGRSVRPGSRRDGSSNASAGAGASSQTGGGRRGGSHMTAPRVLAQMAALARMQLLREERDKALDRRRQLLEDRRRAKETLDELTEGSNSNSSNDMDVEDAAEELETLETELALSKTSLRELDRKLSGEAAAAGLGAADPADKAALLAIPGLQDCIRPLQTEVSALSPPALVALAKGLVSSHVEALYIRTRHDGVVAALRSELAARQLEADEAVRVAQLGQSESAARVSSLRNDYETKISFLLAQLRAAESELKQSTGLLRKSLSGSTSGSISGGVGMNMNMNSNPNSRSTDRQQSAVSGGVGATIDLRGGGLLAHDGTPPRAGVLGTAKAESRPGTSSPRRTGQLTADSATLALLAAERKRREQLERRTGDMMREVQQLRQELRLAQAQ